MDRRIAALASRQEQVVSLGQLIECGLSAHAARQRASAGRLYRRHRGVYSLTPTVSRMGQFWAAVLACGPRAALSHQSAAHVHGLRRHDWGDPHVTVPGTGARQRKGIQVHSSSAALTRVAVDGLAVTDISRTLTDLADVLTPSALQQVVSRAERRELVDRTTFTVPPGRRSAMERPHLFTRSENERALFALCQQHGFPSPLVNQRFGVWEVDFYWPEFRRALEIDAWFTHKDPIAFRNDRLKDEHLDLEHGVIVRRVLDTRLHSQPLEVVALLRRILR